MKKILKLLKNLNLQNRIKEFTLLIFMVLFISSFFLINPSVTGLSFLETPITFYNSTTISLNANISSIKLSGYYEGNGSAKLYLDNYLIFDTSIFVPVKTKEIIIDNPDVFTIQPVIKEKTEFIDICIDTCENLVAINPILKVEIGGNLVITISDIKYSLLQEKEESIQNKAEINKPVEWKLTTKNKSIELPLEAAEITVEKIVNETKEKAKLKDITSASIKDKKVIEVAEPEETELEVTYFTKAPYSIETNFSENSNQNKINKEITIKSDSELHYKDVLSFTEIPESEKNQIHLYHYINNEKVEITNNQIYNISYKDTNNNNLIDKLYWITQELSEQNFSVEISLLILNIQSFPTVYGNWSVNFNTTGTANLTITAFNGTFWSNTNENYDLRFLDLKCGSEIKSYEWINNSVFIQDYSCNETGRESSKVLTAGKHSLQFNYGSITKYAYNIADIINVTLQSPSNNSKNALASRMLNITVESSYIKLFVFAGNSSDLDYNNIIYTNYSGGAIQTNRSINFSALPVKPDGTDGLVLLHHYDNASSPLNSSTYENDTHLLDYSNQLKALNNGTYVRWNTSQYVFTNLSGRFGNSIIFNGINNFISVKNSSAYPTSLQIVQNITIAAWFKLDYNFTNYSATYSNISSQTILDKGDYALYLDQTSGSLKFQLNNASNSNWSQARYSTGTFAGYDKLHAHNGHLYASASGAGSGEITKLYVCLPDYNTTGDDTLCDHTEWFPSFNSTTRENFRAMASFNGNLYLGIGDTGGASSSGSEGEIWVCHTNNTGNLTACEDTTGSRSDWALSFNNSVREINVLYPYNGKLYAGTGNNASGDTGAGDIFLCSPNQTGDEKICDTGDWRKSYDTGFKSILSLKEYNGNLYAGADAPTAGSIGARVIYCNPELNTTNLGEGLTECDQNEWNLSMVLDSDTASLAIVPALEEFNGKLYAGVGGTSSNGAGDVFLCDPDWNTTGDDSICDRNEWNKSFDGGQDIIRSLKTYNGKLYSGQGDSTQDGDSYVCNPAFNSTGDKTECDWNEWNTSTTEPIFNSNGTIISTFEVFNGRLYTAESAGTSSASKDNIYYYDNIEYINSSTTTWTKNRWYHVAATYNGTTMLLYINGILENTKHINFTIEQNQTNLLIGYGTYGYFNGTIDEVAVWNRSLSRTEIENLYNLSVSTITYFWKANATDANGNQNNTGKFQFTIGPNTAPANVNTTLRPASPVKFDNLNCSLTYLEPDNEAGTVTIKFYNGTTSQHFESVNISVTDNNTVVSYVLVRNQSNAFIKSESWTCTAKSNDGTISSAWVNSSVTIGNTAPNNASPFIFPETPAKLDNLNASSFAQDPDADNVTVEIVFWNGSREHFRINITQSANATNKSYALITNLTNNFTKGENWTAALRITDNSSASSDWFNTSIIISNLAPRNPNTTFIGDPFTIDSNINCSATYMDTDFDRANTTFIFYNASIEHFRTNITIANQSNNTVVSSILSRNITNPYIKNETWVCAIRFDDGSASDWINATTLIGNVMPENISTFTFIPSSVDIDNSTFNFTVNASDRDTSESLTVEFVFWNGTSVHFRRNVTQANNSVLSYTILDNASNVFVANDNITVAVRISDGNVSGSWQNDSIVITAATAEVVGTPPAALPEPKGSSSQSDQTGSISTSTANIQLLSEGNIYKYNHLASGLNTITMQDSSLALVSLDISVSTLINNPEIKITESNNIPNIKNLENVYKYIDVESTNLLNSAINDRTFNFKLSKSLVKDKEVSLYMNENNNWVKLSTDKVKEEGSFNYYKASSPHLSIFAIRIYREETAVSKIEIPIINYAKEITHELTDKEKTSYSIILVLILLFIFAYFVLLFKFKLLRHITVYLLVILTLILIPLLFAGFNLNRLELQKDLTDNEIGIYSILLGVLIELLIISAVFLTRKLTKKTGRHKSVKHKTKKAHKKHKIKANRPYNKHHYKH